jgi:hypothetical protein
MDDTVYFFQVGSIIKNPEILALVPFLLLTDPNGHTKHSLGILLQVDWVIR